jgi:DinB superfamily
VPRLPVLRRHERLLVSPGTRRTNAPGRPCGAGPAAFEDAAAGLPYCPPVAGKRAETLLETMLFIEMFTLRRAWDGLTDDELMWEPADGAWTVRPVSERRTATPFVTGSWEADFDVGLVEAAVDGRAVEPMPSIAWLFWHVGSQPGRAAELDFLGGPHSAASGWTSPYIAEHAIFTTADAAVTAMQAGWRTLDVALQSATDEQLERPTRFWGYGGPGPPGTGAQIVGSILNEVSHHGTQIGVMRDLYRVRAG